MRTVDPPPTRTDPGTSPPGLLALLVAVVGMLDAIVLIGLTDSDVAVAFAFVALLCLLGLFVWYVVRAASDGV